MLGVLLFVISCSAATQASPPKCGLYGAPPCVYVPAPPGHTPSCASPGKTYCENMPHYPKRVVHNLLHRYGHDIDKLLVDEIAADFSANHPKHPSVFGPDFSHHYNPPPPASYPTPSSYYPQPTVYDTGYQYPNPNQLHPGYDYSPPDKPIASYNYGPSKRYQPNSVANNPQRYVYEVQRVSEYNPAESFKRYTRDISRKMSPLREADRPAKQPTPTVDTQSVRNQFIEMIKPGNHTRVKRQSFGRSTLCEVNTQFIMPQAALNNQGNWMYVINQNSQAKQLVKAETCASSVCSNLCQLPSTYTTRCEQKFIQKRLIALNADGQNFYTDTFWFPSCCVCTISNL